MQEFFSKLISTAWGITIIICVSVLLFLFLSIVLYKVFFKRFYDILLSGIAIILLSPILIVLILLGTIMMRGNPFFTQKRPGKNEKVFKMVKFRTMINRKDANGNLLSDAKRLTKYGKFLRKTSLDELPEIFNIFAGQMSIIGPRPLLVQYLTLYNNEQRKRHNVRPGLTGLAQVSGRNAIGWEKKFEKDIEYIKKITFFSDLKIFFLTIKKVLIKEGISQENNATMEYFMGNNNSQINILILSVGRRVELVKEFMNSKAKCTPRSKVVAVDISKSAPALYFADNYELIVPIKSESYIENLIEICKKHNIAAIIPTIDTELPILATNKEYIFEQSKAKVLISDKEVIDICCDKYNTDQFFEENMLNCPHTLSKEEIKTAKDFPYFIKPCDGSSSINTFSINTRKELDFFYEYIQNPLVQKKLVGKEYTVDVFCDFNSNPITIVPRRRLAVRGGEILKGQIEKNQFIIEECSRLVKALKPVAHITIQGFLCEDDKFYFLEINPRFGGGAPMSIKAGANSCEHIYKMLLGEDLKYNDNYTDGIIYSRFDDSVVIVND